MSHRTSLALVLAASLLSAGCGTLDNVNRPAIAPPNNPDAKVCRVYGGVRGDFSTMLEYPWSQTPSPLDYVTIPVLAVGDLAFDVVFDTITLPYTAYEEIRRATYRPEASSTYLPVEVPKSKLTPATPQSPGTPLPQPRPAETPAPTSPR